jgi:trimethylamine--corrinoid protein Co-methyltransferase
MKMDFKLDFTIRPKMSVISKEEIDYLHSGALDVLERVGVRVLHPEALDLLKKAGATIHSDTLVRIRSTLVEKALCSVPKRLTIYDREGKPAMVLGGANTGGMNTYYGTGSDLKNTYDHYTGELRATIARDIANMAKMVDYLPNLEFLMSHGIPSDCPLDRVYRTEFLEMVKNSTKPIVFTSDNGSDSQRIIEMAAVITGGMDRLREKPFVINYSQPTSPLQHSLDALGKVFACAEAGIPVAYPPGMIPGATAPATMAGAITQSIAESLSVLVIHQLKREGAPIILCGAHGWLDMTSAINVYAAPGRLMTQAALTAFYQHFGIPTWGFGGCTDAQVFDQQAGMEFAMLNLWASLCGVNLAHDTAYMGSGMIGCLRSLVYNDEIIGYVRHILCRGVIVNRETQAIDVLDRVGPGGHFMMDEHTLRHFREELWRPTLSNRDRLEAWKEMGAKTVGEKADEKVREILEKHVPKSLPRDITDELEEMRNA